jgi:GT2 family glycosyltransferase
VPIRRWTRIASRAAISSASADRLTATDALAVVVVAYDSEEHLPALLTALKAQLGPSDELIVVDNASSDRSPEVARLAGEPVRVVQTGMNLGFGGGCHVGADATSAPLLLFINPDSEPAASTPLGERGRPPCCCPMA